MDKYIEGIRFDFTDGDSSAERKLLKEIREEKELVFDGMKICPS